MDVLALVLALAAVVVFVLDSRPAATARSFALLPLGLAFLAASYICQCTSITDNWVNL